MAPYFASRISGSYDLYHGSGKGPECSINFVTCHDGFTLNDLVSYSQKHNEDNGEGNRDGTNADYSSNYGVEGETKDPAINTLRCRQIKNMLLTLAISRGVPMLLAGDEFRRTQHGNNNAYCQDNETSWVDWTLLQSNRDIFQFARGMLAFRRAHQVLRREAYYTQDELHWFDPRGNQPDWFDARLKSLACLIQGQDGPDLYLIFNSSNNAARFVLPDPRSGRWRLAADTTRPTPRNFYTPGSEVLLRNPQGYLIAANAAAILVAG